uniref:Uncharacterized protein n=1 Tax=Rhizophora mucronata TaxID=61149 RepID=A0A2P2MJQ2_RHIMU
MCSPIDYLPTSGHRLIRVEWWVTHKHFIHDSTKRPPITFHSISFLQQNFRGNIIRRSNGRISKHPSVPLPML